MIQNAAARLVFNEPKRAHAWHWLPVAARIKFKTLMLGYRTTTGSAPFYFYSLLQIYIPSRRLLVSVASWDHHREAQNHSPEHSRSLFLADGMIPPYPDCWIPVNLQATTENSSLLTLLDFILTPHPKKNKKKQPETWCYEHFLCLFASSRLITLCIPQL